MWRKPSTIEGLSPVSLYPYQYSVTYHLPFCQNIRYFPTLLGIESQVPINIWGIMRGMLIRDDTEIAVIIMFNWYDIDGTFG